MILLFFLPEFIMCVAYSIADFSSLHSLASYKIICLYSRKLYTTDLLLKQITGFDLACLFSSVYIPNYKFYLFKINMRNLS